MPSAFSTLNAYMSKCGFERAFTEGNANVTMSKYVDIGLGNIWDAWDSAPYIYINFQLLVIEELLIKLYLMSK